MMSCHEVNVLLEAVAVGEPVPDAVRAHVGDCPSVRRGCDSPSVSSEHWPPRRSSRRRQRFHHRLVARVRRERWRAEQMLDWGFNIFVAVGVGLIVVGVGGPGLGVGPGGREP